LLSIFKIFITFFLFSLSVTFSKETFHELTVSGRVVTDFVWPSFILEPFNQDRDVDDLSIYSHSYLFEYNFLVHNEEKVYFSTGVFGELYNLKSELDEYIGNNNFYTLGLNFGVFMPNLKNIKKNTGVYSANIGIGYYFAKISNIENATINDSTEEVDLSSFLLSLNMGYGYKFLFLNQNFQIKGMLGVNIANIVSLNLSAGFSYYLGM
jgi:hypothetical protein